MYESDIYITFPLAAFKSKRICWIFAYTVCFVNKIYHAKLFVLYLIAEMGKNSFLFLGMINIV